jgi:hypothetical protein
MEPPGFNRAREEPIFKASAETPYLSVRCQRMLVALEDGGVLALWDELRIFAAEDKRRSEPNYPGLDKLQLKDSMTKVLHDAGGPRHMLRLLASMPPAVVKALITNTIGWQYKTNAAFRQLFCSTSNSAGIYINTITRQNAGAFLSRRDFETYRDMVKNYLELRLNDAEAMRIDCILQSAKSRKCDTASGQRLWLSGGGATNRHLAALSNRINPELDAQGDIQQHQSAIEVGISCNMAKRMKDHSLESDLSSSTKPWGLMLSCLTVMGIDFEIIALPVLHIWHKDQREIAEIMVTTLASSLVEDGGYNPIQAGTSSGTQKLSYRLEELQVFVEKPWLSDGLRDFNNQLQYRNSIIGRFKRFLDYDFDGQKNMTERALSDVRRGMAEMEVAIHKNTNRIEEAEAAKTNIEHAYQEEEQAISAQLHFLDAAHSWLFSGK